MQLHQLEHLIRAAGTITDRYEFIVVGSQSILGSVERPPFECLMSNEADLYPKEAEELSDIIDGALGEGSQFHDTFGYYAQGVDSTTAILPQGWQGRLHRLQTPSTNDRIAYCIDVLDLFMAKCAANREKDREFNVVLLRAGLVDAPSALLRVPDMPIDVAARSHMVSLITRLATQAAVSGPLGA
ncbi:DUF6036 family nucleotidyltransferase [Polaromonas sp. C04]|uniref:DUF6036 family nucleotidyltransferase n=1 Tax=Polaromonas sp. C04 TaxID=1945857 RepID=UPI000984400A|nr:DUF6036 family nucleotidyltransferase [Polaromonas sp. C04]OOG58045.1 hypothetical protein B0E49_04235 [Polaromonas sp. C04]